MNPYSQELDYYASYYDRSPYTLREDIHSFLLKRGVDVTAIALQFDRDVESVLPVLSRHAFPDITVQRWAIDSDDFPLDDEGLSRLQYSRVLETEVVASGKLLVELYLREQRWKWQHIYKRESLPIRRTI